MRHQTGNNQRRLTVWERRRARRLAYANGLLWGLGNGLASTMALVFWAVELGAWQIGLGVSLLRAGPHLLGVLRLSAPALIGRLSRRKGFCLAAYLASGCVLASLPLLARPSSLRSASATLAVLIALWCVYHLLEYLGTVALWSWLGDLVRQRIRGRFLGVRQRWMVAGQAVGMAACGLFAYYWKRNYPELKDQWWIAYAVPVGLGAAVMIAALAPLARMPGLGAARAIPARVTAALIARPFSDRRFLRLVLFGCWFSFFNGLTAPLHDLYPKQVLHIDLLVILGLSTAMRCGQLAIGPWAGRMADRFGNRPVMAVSLLLVASGELFFLAGPQHRWLVCGAWVAWIAWTGLNVCLPNLMLALSPRPANVPYIAMYYAVTDLCVAGSMIAGGAMSDALRGRLFCLFPGAPALDYFHVAFLLGWVTRSLGLLLLFWVIEPHREARG